MKAHIMKYCTYRFSNRENFEKLALVTAESVDAAEKTLLLYEDEEVNQFSFKVIDKFEVDTRKKMFISINKYDSILEIDYLKLRNSPKNDKNKPREISDRWLDDELP